LPREDAFKTVQVKSAFQRLACLQCGSFEEWLPVDESPEVFDGDPGDLFERFLRQKRLVRCDQHVGKA
jgi:hypothetical protein